jgi:hypothetical protein
MGQIASMLARQRFFQEKQLYLLKKNTAEKKNNSITFTN